MKTRKYTINLTAVPSNLPKDVLVEHIAVAVRGIRKGDPHYKAIGVEIAQEKRGRQHPFDGPEVNDDPVVFHGPNREMEILGTLEPATQAPEFADVVEVDFDEVVGAIYTAIGEDFPNLADLFQAKREERELHRSRDAAQPEAEGDWSLSAEDRVGED